MAIVPDKSGTRPGRPGNIPLSDPNNRSAMSRTFVDDAFREEKRLSLSAGNQLILVADATRNGLTFSTPFDEGVVYVSTIPMTIPSGLPVYSTSGLQIRGGACEKEYYAYSTSDAILTVLIG